MILSADDPWWDEHYPPDGYGCNCFVQPVDVWTMEKLGKVDEDGNPVPDIPPPDAVKKPSVVDGGPIPQRDLEAALEQSKTTSPEPNSTPASQPIPEPTEPAPSGDIPATPNVPETTQPSLPPEVVPSDVQQAIENAKQEAENAKQEAEKAKQEEEAKRKAEEEARRKAEEEAKRKAEEAERKMKEHVAERIERAKEAMLEAMKKKDAKRFKEALEAMAKASTSPIGIAETEEELAELVKANGMCVYKVSGNPRPEDYIKIRFNKDYVTKCLAENAMMEMKDIYGFLYDPKTLDYLKIPGKTRLDITIVHELAHLVDPTHSAKHDKLIYDTMCKLIPDYSNYHSVMRSPVKSEDVNEAMTPWTDKPKGIYYDIWRSLWSRKGK